MKAFLRTLWKDMVILRWWLLAWTAAVAGFAVWRDHLATQWDASSFDSKPDADTVQKVLLGFAAVIAVRLMHTDKLHGDFAFWRTRPTSALRLAFAKLVLGFLWLFLLPVAVELALLYHWGWQDWCAPCIATWAIALGAVLVPAFCVAAFIPATSVAMPVGLLLAWFSFESRPGEGYAWMSVPGIVASAFWAFYARTLLGCIVTLIASASHMRTAAGLAVLMLVPYPGAARFRLPDFLDPASPARADGPAPIVLETSAYADRVYLRFPDTKQPVWAGNSGQPITLAPADGSEPVHYLPSEQLYLPVTQLHEQMQAGSWSFPWPGDDFACLFLNQNLAWGQVHAIPEPQFKSEKAGRVISPVRFGTFDDPICGEIPLVAGSSWTHGPFRITLTEITASKAGPAFRLRFERPQSRAGLWTTNLHGSACSTNIRLSVINRRLGLYLRGSLRGSAGEKHTVPTKTSISSALYRKSTEIIYQPEISNLDDHLRGARELDGELFRDAILVFAEWRITERGEKSFELDTWPPPPPTGWAKEDRPLRAKELAALQKPSLNDETSIARYIDSLIRLRYQLKDGYSLHEVKPKFDYARFTGLGSKWLPLIIRRWAVYVPVGPYTYDFQTKGERSEWIDILAAQMAVPEHGPLLLDLMRGGLPLHRTILAHEWFRRMAIPELAQIAAMFDLGGVWLSVMVELNDPALNPAIIAWFRPGYVEDRLQNAFYRWDKPGFPRAEVLAALSARKSEMLPESRGRFAFLQSLSGIPEGMQALAAWLAEGSWKKDSGGAPYPFGEFFQRLQQVIADGPAEPDKVVAWIIANGPKLRWAGTQWVLPPANEGPR